MKRSFTASFVLLVLLATASCNNGNNGGDEPLPDAKPIVLKPEYQAKTAATREFSIELFKVTVARSEGQNVLISPYSVNTALGMLWNGTAGETDSEMQSVLGNGTYGKDQINDYARTLTGALLKADPSSDMKIANSIWADQTTPFKTSFIDANEKWYDAEVRNVDFTRPETLGEIDRWCKNATSGRIDRISEGMDRDTRFALINAVYFKGKWKYKFKKSDTKNEEFLNSSGSGVSVPMMNVKEELPYSDDDRDWKMLSLPYGNGAFSMLLLMPYGEESLDEMTGSLTAEKFTELFNTLGRYTVTVKLPRFKAEYAYRMNENILPDIGLKKIFEPLEADLSGMCEVPMYVNMVMHKTYIDVNEEGTEAAAVTSGSGIATSPGPGTPIYFNADRPFIYSIVENSTGTILFMGLINNP